MKNVLAPAGYEKSHPVRMAFFIPRFLESVQAFRGYTQSGLLARGPRRGARFGVFPVHNNYLIETLFLCVRGGAIFRVSEKNWFCQDAQSEKRGNCGA